MMVVAVVPSQVEPLGQVLHTLLSTYLVAGHTVAVVPSQMKPLGQALHTLLSMYLVASHTVAVQRWSTRCECNDNQQQQALKSRTRGWGHEMLWEPSDCSYLRWLSSWSSRWQPRITSRTSLELAARALVLASELCNFVTIPGVKCFLNLKLICNCLRRLNFPP